jgi:hypothetical protein
MFILGSISVANNTVIDLIDYDLENNETILEQNNEIISLIEAQNVTKLILNDKEEDALNTTRLNNQTEEPFLVTTDTTETNDTFTPFFDNETTLKQEETTVSYTTELSETDNNQTEIYTEYSTSDNSFETTLDSTVEQYEVSKATVNNKLLNSLSDNLPLKDVSHRNHKKSHLKVEIKNKKSNAKSRYQTFFLDLFVLFYKCQS